MSGTAKCSMSGGRARFAGVLGTSACAFIFLIAARAVVAGEPPLASRVQGDLAVRAARTSTLRRAPVPWDDGTYRPTVLVRRGTSQGSGTIIASVDGDTLVLTAAHVVKGEGSILVELHRYNLGMERHPATPGVWPRVIRASLAAVDTAADLAIIRVSKMTALPYVARFAEPNVELLPDTVVNSIGIDLGHKLTRWKSRLVDTVKFQLNDSRVARPFLITEKVPEHGRSGGGLFLAGGELVGVCIGHSELIKGKRLGVFAAGESIHRLLHDHELADTVRRSELRLARIERRGSPARPGNGPKRANSVVTPTRSLAGEQPGPPAP